MDKFCNSKGFTIAELLVSMMIGLLILFSVYNIFTNQIRQFKTQSVGLEMLQNARVGLDFIVRELRIAGYSPTGALPACQGTNTATNTPCVGLTAIAGGSISFTADLDGDGSLTPDDTNPDENITYAVYADGGVLCLGRTANGSRQPAVENISALSFNYYDGSNQTTTNLARIRKISVSLTARASIPDVNKVYKTITFSSDVVPRNITD